MQSSKALGQTSNSRDSPVFFTGCSSNSPRKHKKTDNNTAVDPKNIISSIDFDRLKQSVDLILTHGVSTSNNTSGANHNSEASKSNKLNFSPNLPSSRITGFVHENNHQHLVLPCVTQLNSPVHHFRNELGKNNQIPESSHSYSSSKYPEKLSNSRKRLLSDIPLPSETNSFVAPSDSSYDKRAYDKRDQPVLSSEMSVPRRRQNSNEFHRNRKRKRLNESTPDYDYKRSKLTFPFPPPPPPSQPRNLMIFWEQLSKDIWKLYKEYKQSETVFASKMGLRDQLHGILRQTFPQCGLFVVGSSMTGLGGDNSDMDMCLMLPGNEVDQTEDAPNILTTVYSVFSHYDFLHNLELIPAKVPILRFKDSISGWKSTTPCAAGKNVGQMP